jgi:hypothetical protein
MFSDSAGFKLSEKSAGEAMKKYKEKIYYFMR